jgi:hypothetical protein
VEPTGDALDEMVDLLAVSLVSWLWILVLSVQAQSLAALALGLRRALQEDLQGVLLGS